MFAPPAEDFYDQNAMFKEVLREMVEKAEGGLASLLIDAEGIAIDSYSLPRASFDINAVGVEFGVVVSSIRRAANSLGAGGTHEIVIATEKMTVVIRILKEQYFLVLAIAPEGNLGKARYVLRTQAPKLLSELG